MNTVFHIVDYKNYYDSSREDYCQKGLRFLRTQI